jgi:hypothetical protein
MMRNTCLMKMALGVLACAASTGCVVAERGEFAGTRFDARQYEDARIGILPVAMNPDFPTRDFPAARLQAAVASAVAGSLGLHSRPAIDDDAARANPFPYTPGRLAESARRLQYDGLLGVSVSSWDAGRRPPPSGDGRVRVDLLVAFSDARDPASHWTVTGAWAPSTLDDIGDNVDATLPFILRDLRRALAPHPLTSWFSRPQPPGPILTFTGPKTLMTEGNMTDAKFVDLLVTSIDEAGIASLAVEAGESGYAWKLEGQENGNHEKPVFLSGKLRVPLAHGENHVTMKAQSAAASQPLAQRHFSIETSAHHEVFGLVIQSSAVGGSAVRLADARGVRSTSVRGSPPDADAVQKSLAALDQRAADGDTVVVYVAGRVRQADGLLVLEAPSGMRAPRERRPAALEDIVHAARSGDRMLVMDLCGEASRLADLRAQVALLLHNQRWTLARLRPCDARTDELAGALSALFTPREDALHAKEYFTAFMAAVRPQDVAAWPDLLGDASADASVAPAGRVEPTTPVALAPLAVGVVAAVALAEQRTARENQFYVVVYATDEQDDARREARRLRASGTRAGVLKGTSGNYGVAVASADSVGQANEQLRRARSLGQAPAEAYILPPSRVASVLDPLDPLDPLDAR